MATNQMPNMTDQIQNHVLLTVICKKHPNVSKNSKLRQTLAPVNSKRLVAREGDGRGRL